MAALAATALLVGTVAARGVTGSGPATSSSPTGAFGQGVVLPNGRLVTPAGSTVDVGAFPLGVAVSPDGHLVATINSGYPFGLNTGFNSYCGQGQNNGNPGPCPYIAADPSQSLHVGDPAEPTYDESLSVLDVGSGAVQEVKAIDTTTDPRRVGQPGTFNFFYVGVAFSPDGQHLYAAGGGNNAVYDFPVKGSSVGPRPSATVVLPSTFAGPTVGPFSPNYPVFGPVGGFTKGLTVTRDGRYVLVAHEFNNTLDIVDTATHGFSQVALDANPPPFGGFYPYGVAVSADGSTAYVSGQGLGQVAMVKLAGGSGSLVGYVGVGDHPTALALSPDGAELYVANADSDTLSIVSTAKAAVVATVELHALRGEQLGSTPNAVAVSRDGRRVYVALAGDDAVAVLGRSGTAGWVVQGFIPAGWYPSAVAVSPDDSYLYVASAKGLGSRYVPPFSPSPAPGAISDTYEYDASNMPGILQKVAAPVGAALGRYTDQVRRDVAFAQTANRRPHNPVPAHPGDPSPITHVIEVVRENRTFDQVLGDLGSHQHRPPSQVDGLADYVLFGRDVTPNAHALVGDAVVGTSPDGSAEPAFATSDNFFSDGEASVQGHWWTAAANVNDYVEKSWPQYYSPRNHVYDPESTVTQPHNCTIFQSALRHQLETAGRFTVRNYGELIGLQGISVQGVNQGFTGPGEVPNPCVVLPSADIDPRAVQDQNLDVDNRQTAAEFLDDIGLNPDGTPTSGGRAGTDFLRNFSYITLSGDHTGGLAFAETPRSRVAENDAGLGLIVQAISHSPYWSSTAILVMEDDSQDGLDHIDGHRNLLFATSPYAKHVGPDGKPGYVGHQHYSQASVLKTIELLLGLPFLSTYDQNARALYDLFQDKDRPELLTPADRAAFSLQPLPRFVPEPSSCYASGRPAPTCPATGAAALSPASRVDLMARSRALDTSRIDAAGPDLEVIAWQLAHPDRAVPRQLMAERRAWERSHPPA